MKADELLEMDLALDARRNELTMLMEGENKEYAVRHLSLTHRLIRKRQLVHWEVKHAARL